MSDETRGRTREAPDPTPGRGPARIYFGDLNHQGHNVKTFPYAVGCVASVALARHPGALTVDIFKCPDELGDAILAAPPTVLALGNYIWNSYLAYEVVKKAKELDPSIVVVMGGPNYPEERAGQIRFLEDHPLVDFYVYHEGEIPFSDLLAALRPRDYSVAALKEERLCIPGCHYLHEGELVAGGSPAKIADIDATVPSPYLTGLFDKFFEAGLQPLLQFKRGCPFSCTFCVEGLDYYSKLGMSSVDRMRAELEYCAERVRSDETLYLADANFGMFKDDLAFCEAIADVQRTHGWPTKINASTGKNQQERILNATRIVQGALRFGAALQSTDDAVLKNIKRTGISTGILLGAAKKVREFGQASYSEIILNLPGDTFDTHVSSISAPIDGGISRIQMYPLLLLPGTEMASPETRESYAMRAKWRILPRCYGRYRFGAATYPAAEVVEMLIETNTMSFPEYLDCKEFELTVELFYNDGYFDEIRGLIELHGIPMSDFIRECHSLRSRFPADLQALYDGLRSAVDEELFATREECERFVREGDNLDRYEKTEYRNSLATNRAIGVFSCARSLHSVAGQAIRALLRKRDLLDPEVSRYVDELLAFSLLRKDNPLDTAYAPVGEFSYDFQELSAARFATPPRRRGDGEARTLRFWHPSEQARRIEVLSRQHDDPVLRMRHVLYHSMVTTVGEYFRSFE